MHLGLFPNGELRLQNETTTELFQPLTPWISSLEALTAITGFLFISSLTGSFRCRLGIQTCNIEEQPNAVSAIGSQPAQISTAGIAAGTAYRFDPNVVGNGDIDNGVVKFRLGILHSASAAATSQGLVRWEALAWR